MKQVVGAGALLLILHNKGNYLAMLRLLTLLLQSSCFLLILGLQVIQPVQAATHTVEINIKGIASDELIKNILAYLSLEQQKHHPKLSASRIRRLHKQAPDEIKHALEPFGYYRPKITAQHLEHHQAVWQAEYTVDLGEPVRLKTIEVRIQGAGETDPAFKKLQAEFPLKVGDVLNHPLYDKGKRLLRNLAEELGYFDAELTQHEIRLDEQAYIAALLLTLETGKRYRFGTVSFHQDTFADALLQRFLTFKPGDFYTASQLLAFRNALTDSDYFGMVEVTLDRAAPVDDRLPVNVTLEPRKPDKFSIGVGYGTDTGARSSFGWERRYINRYGHRFTANVEFSEIRQSTTARYHIPLGQVKDDYLAITAGHKNEAVRNIDSELFLFGISKNHDRTWLDMKLREVIGIEYRDEKYAIGSDTGHSKLLMPNISWSYVQADNRIYTLHGHKIQLEVRGALEQLGSNTSFLQTRLSGVFIRQLHKKGRLIARGEAGYSSVALLEGEFNDLPPSIRFFAGGDRSVRGYDYRTLGPLNEEGDVIGGKNLLVGSLEYEHRILEKWSLAAFYDTGNAFNDFSEPLKKGAGVGVRWHSPVGLIRIDVAAALEDDYPLRLHVTVGPDL